MDEFIGQYRMELDHRLRFPAPESTTFRPLRAILCIDPITASMEALLRQLLSFSRFRWAHVPNAFKVSRLYVKKMSLLKYRAEGGTEHCTEQQLGNRLALKFLHLLEDDKSMSLETKHRIRDAAYALQHTQIISAHSTTGYRNTIDKKEIQLK